MIEANEGKNSNIQYIIKYKSMKFAARKGKVEE